MRVSKKTYKKLSALRSAYIDDRGREVNNPKPIHIAGEARPPTLQERIQRVMRQELSKEAAAQEMETFEESQDFDVDDEFEVDEPYTPYQIMEEEIPLMSEEPVLPDEKLEEKEEEKEEEKTEEKSEDKKE